MDRIINLAAWIKVGYMNRRTLMLDKKLYSKTEGRLYRYFRDIEEIDKLEGKVKFRKNRRKGMYR